MRRAVLYVEAMSSSVSLDETELGRKSATGSTVPQPRAGSNISSQSNGFAVLLSLRIPADTGASGSGGEGAAVLWLINQKSINNESGVAPGKRRARASEQALEKKFPRRGRVVCTLIIAKLAPDRRERYGCSSATPSPRQKPRINNGFARIIAAARGEEPAEKRAEAKLYTRAAREQSTN